jgi:hypothetical protein
MRRCLLRRGDDNGELCDDNGELYHNNSHGHNWWPEARLVELPREPWGIHVLG